MPAAPVMTREYAIGPQNGINPAVAAACNAGDWLFCLATTSDYLHRLTTPTGPPTNGWTLRQISETLDWGNGYIWTAQATANWSGTFTVPISTMGNAGAREAMFWLWGFDARSSGLGVTAMSRFSGAPGTTLVGCRANSQGLVGMVDWNAGAFTGGSEVYRIPVGNVAAAVKNYAIHTAAANWVYGRYPDMGAAGDKLVGLSSPTTWKSTILAIEVLADWTVPSVPTGVVATALSQSSARVDWNASTDNFDPATAIKYQVFRGATLLGTTAAGIRTWTDTALTAGTAYSYTVKAVDTTGNVSAASAAAPVTTPLEDVRLGANIPKLTLCETPVIAAYVGGTKVYP